MRIPPAVYDRCNGHRARVCPLRAALVLLGGVALGSASTLAGAAAELPLSVSLLQTDGAAVQLRVRVPEAQTPVLNWLARGSAPPGRPGDEQAAPYRLVLTWADAAVTLDRPLPDMTLAAPGPLQSVRVQNMAGQGGLEFLLRDDVVPHLRRVSDSWVLQLEPAHPVDPALPLRKTTALAPPPLVPTPQAGAVQLAANTAAPAFFPSSSPLPSPSAAPAQSGAAPVRSRPKRLALAGGAKNGTAPRLPAVEVLLVDVTVNGQRLKNVVRAEQRPGGPLLLPVEAWTEARLVPLAQATVLSDGTPAYALDALPGASYKINRQTLSLAIDAAAKAFTGSTLAAQGTLAEPPPRPQPGVMLNYDAALSHASGSASGGVTLEAVAFNGFGTIVTSALASANGGQHSATRLDTYWRYDLPHRMETLVVGDTVGVGGGWSRPARYGGLRWGRDFGMRPGFVTLPQLSLAGEAALPSTVEVLVNNARRLSLPVQPGPFDLPNVPVVTGAGEVNLVVRDLLGRETVVRQSYYMAPRLLAPGLTDFSFEAGWLRTGYGRDSAYGDGFGTATWRQGLTSRLTGEGRVELQHGRRAAGVELAGVLGTWGAGRLALAATTGDRQGFQETGHLLQLGVERSTPTGGGALHYEQASRGFAPFGEAIGPAAVAPRARVRWLASLSSRLWGTVSGGANLVRQTRWDGDQVTSLGLSLSLPVWQGASLTASLDRRLDGDQALRAGVSISLPLDNGIHTSARVDRAPSGKLTGTASAAKNPPAGPGLGWQVQASTSPSQRAQAGLQGHTSQAEFTLDAVATDSGRVATRASGRGTVGWVGGMGFASRPVGQGSVAVVQVGDMEGVPVKRANQVVAVTNAEGRAFVAGLVPWQKNAIEIDPVDLPLDVEITNTVQQVTPYARTGVVVDFGLRRTRQALLLLQDAAGKPVPVGAKVRLLPDGPELITGRRGETWLTDLAEKTQRVQVRWPQGGCTLELPVPASPDGTPGKIGPLVCEGGTP